MISGRQWRTLEPKCNNRWFSRNLMFKSIVSIVQFIKDFIKDPPPWPMPSATEDACRLHAISDGVFAISMTLLILDIHVSHLTPYLNLATAVLSLWPHFAVYAFSFLFIGQYWVSHHLIFNLIERSDRGLAWLNLGFLLFIVVIPFSTALLAQFLNDWFAILFYNVNLILVGLFLQTIWTYATTKLHLVDRSIDHRTIRLGTLRLMSLPSIGALSTVLMLMNAPSGWILYVVLLVILNCPFKWTPYWPRDRAATNLRKAGWILPIGHTSTLKSELNQPTLRILAKNAIDNGIMTHRVSIIETRGKVQ
jgi:uncharacterized membrane protein